MDDQKSFDVKSFAKSHGITYGSARVTLTRLQKKHEFIRVGRGKYRRLSRENRAKLEDLRSKNECLLDLVTTLYEELPDLKMILIFGSQARGDADSLSDVDVLVISEPGMDMGERKKFQEKLSDKLKRQVEIKVISEAQYRKWSLLELKLRFWLREGIIFDECGLSREIHPVSKMGLLEALNFINLQLKLSKQGEKDASYLFTALKELLTLKHTLDLDYDTRNLKCDMLELLGKNLCTKLRAISKGKRLSLSRSEISTLTKTVFTLYPEMVKKVKRLGENEADFYLKKL